MYTFKRNDIVILLGAGASVDAGIPNSTEMIERVQQLVEKGQPWERFFDLYHYVRSSIHYADGIKGKIGNNVSYNIERLVEALDELCKRDEHTLYPFVGAWNPKLLEVAGFNFEKVQQLKERIVERLRNEWLEIKQYETAEYYEGLVQFQQAYQHPLRVFTLNYDLGVEKACGKVLHKFPERGFERREWDWRLFEDSENDPKEIFLYKLHGSTDWQRDHNGSITFLDSPSAISPSDVAIIFGTSYKLQYVDPFLFLAYEFRKWTLDTRLIVAIGYGFGDEHINTIIRQALINNPDRKLLSVTPSPPRMNSAEEVARIVRLLDNIPNSDQIEHWAYTAKDFMTEHLTVAKLGTLFLDDRPELFPEDDSLNPNGPN